jgi:radical SAM superfamily enzyme YgiQ (UPF0313 family)
MPLIVFINPVESHNPGRGELLKGYLSLGSLAAALRDRRFMGWMASRLGYSSAAPIPAVDAVVVHMEPGLTVRQIAARLSAVSWGAEPPIMVGATATAARLECALTAARAARQVWPEVFLLAGGPHVSAAPESLVAPGAFQAACLGEGVETVAELALKLIAAGAISPSEIAGLCWHDPDGAIRRSRPRRHVFELDDYPPPSRSLDLFLPGGRREAAGSEELVFILSGYGCPCDCAFCAQRAIHGGRIRERSAEGIFREIEELFALGYRNFALVQESFFNRRKRIDRFLSLIESSGLELRWTAEARCDQLDRGLLGRMKAAGLKMIQIGLESGDPELLAGIGKNLDLDHAAAVMRTCRELEIDTAVYLLVGLPGQDWRSILRSARFLMKNPPFNRATGHVSVSVALPYPGTRLAKENSVRLVNPSGGIDWPRRSPEVRFDPAGRLRVEPVAETNWMTAEEVSESFFFLDDFCQFLIASGDSGLADEGARGRAAGYAARMLGMIVQRTIRELAVCARPGAEAQRRAGLAEIARRHGPENHLADMTASALELTDESLIDFLVQFQLASGQAAMRMLNWRQRLQVIKFCARRWIDSGRAFARAVIEPDRAETGAILKRILGGPGAADASAGRPPAAGLAARIEHGILKLQMGPEPARMAGGES